MRQATPPPNQPTTTQRGLGKDWQRLRIKAFNLYGHNCWLCGHPGADTIDHLDPRSTHGVRVPTIDRVRPAHRSCNSKRGNRPLNQPTNTTTAPAATSRRW